MASQRSLGALRLREWRQAKGLTLAGAGRQLDVDQMQMSKFERGERKPGRTTAVRIEQRTDGRVTVESWDVDVGEEAGEAA
jgi:transcriptional regulator with XRE-family HTH domain